MNSQNTICAIFGLVVPTGSMRKRIRGRLPAHTGGVVFGGHIVPITQGALVCDLFGPTGVLRT
jgi:hypothetical protein